MLPPLIEQDVPHFLTTRNTIAYCSQLHVRKSKSSLVLSRQLRFYEFANKQLLHHIDLRATCLQQLEPQLQTYTGPISSFLRRDDVLQPADDAANVTSSYSMLHAAEELPLSIGKYVWQGKHIYVLLRCWHTLIVLQRPATGGGSFELIAQHEQLEDYRLVRDGTLKYQAYVELQFINGKRMRCNFQPTSSSSSNELPPSSSSSNNNNSAAGFQRLLQRVHGARAELQTQRALTQQDFVRAQEQQTFGVPAQRSPLLEEKQLLRRCGDVWTRICGASLVLGTLLNNTTSSVRPCVLHGLRPLLHLSSGNGLNYTHRLYELPLQADAAPPEDYDELAQFWACQEQHSTNISWRLVTNNARLPPERSAVLLVRLQLHELIVLGQQHQQEQLQLLALYELHGQRRQQLQLQLASIELAPLLEQTQLHVPRFAAHTLHQDFLALIMTQTAHCPLRLKFPSAAQQLQFEQLLTTKLELRCHSVKQESQPLQLLDEATPPGDFGFGEEQRRDRRPRSTVQRIFYNPATQLLLLHNDPEQHWHIYAGSESELCLLLRRLLRDLLQLHCNVTLLELHQEACNVPANAALLMESALRDELQARAELLQLPSRREQVTANALKRVHQLELASDLLFTVINGQTQMESIP
ncbi:uncharacterized protein LOC132796489 [Drosophila nasuta]|uniref:uncharacterized protein LOC132796489 n=1 Tax=Drosophila nasuta TaxID=42062 RepID=UPI00295E58D5|nr:uncharacterized protein LOC132796489 [Drosophila nasuta]